MIGWEEEKETATCKTVAEMAAKKSCKTAAVACWEEEKETADETSQHAKQLRRRLQRQSCKTAAGVQGESKTAAVMGLGGRSKGGCT